MNDEDEMRFLLPHFGYFLNNSDLADIEIDCDLETIPAHNVIFKMRGCTYEPIPIEQQDLTAIKIVLSLIYTGRLRFQELTKEVIQILSLWQAEGLVNCRAFHGDFSVLDDFQDVELTFRDGVIRTNRTFLVWRSKYFASMFTLGFEESIDGQCNLDLFRSNDFQHLLGHMKGEFDFYSIRNSDHLFQLLAQAVYLNIPSSAEDIVDVIASFISFSNVISIWELALFHGVEALQNACRDFVITEFQHYIFDDESMDKLTYSMMHAVLRDGKIVYPTQKLKFAVARWCTRHEVDIGTLLPPATFFNDATRRYALGMNSIMFDVHI